MNGKNGLTLKYCFAQAGFWTACCTIFGYSNVYLTALGFSVETIGMITAAGAILGVMLQALVAGSVDAGKTQLHTLLKLLGSLLATVFVILYVLHGRSIPIYITGLYLVANVMVWILLPLINSISVYYVNHGYPLDFALPRGIGSGCFAVMSVLFGRLILLAGEKIVMFGGAAGSALLVLSVSAMPILPGRENRSEETFGSEHGGAGNLIQFARKYGWFSFMLFGCSLCLVFQNMNNTYIYQIIQNAGGGVDEMGIGMAIAAIVELIPMLLFVWLNRYCSSGKLLVISGMFFAIKAAVFLFAVNIRLFYLAELLQIGSMALWFPASVSYTDEIMRDGDRFKGQAYMSATDTLGAVLGNIIGGFLIGGYGLKAMLLFEFILAFAGALIMLTAYRAQSFRRENIDIN